ncbi:MAG TPA: hypothetical protein VFZ21_30815 [Gemmatimonadaceae bacterium]|nr:hypothetical protein [Gemmatimonadaceae bacterium]
MNWTSPATREEATALALEHQRGHLIRRRTATGYEYAPAAEFEDRWEEIQQDLAALRSVCIDCTLPHDRCDCPDVVQAREVDEAYEQQEAMR